MFYLNKCLKYLMSCSNLMGIFCLFLPIMTFLAMKILMCTKLQGVTWSTFQAPLEGQARHVSTGIFLRCAALCWDSSWAVREEPGFLHLITEVEEFQTTMNGSFFMWRLDVLDWFLIETNSKHLPSSLLNYTVVLLSLLQCGICFPIPGLPLCP